jgi:hypothetical protein
MINREKRHFRRDWLPLSINVEVRLDPGVVWTEDTPIRDVSPLGVGFQLNRPIVRGQLILLTFAMPRPLRRYDLDIWDYKVWGIIRRCLEIRKLKGDPDYAIGVAFIGKKPPPEYFKDPARIFELLPFVPHGEEFWSVATDDDPSKTPGKDIERRRYSRILVPEELIIELIGEGGEVLATETTVTENIGRGGAAVFTSLDADVGSFVRVTAKRHNFVSISMIKDKRLGPDGIDRFHIEFIDRPFPLDGME